MTSELVDCCGASVDDEPVNMAGSILPVKFPLDVQQTGVSGLQHHQDGRSLLRSRARSEKFGINTIVFTNEVPPTKVGNLEVPTSAGAR